MKANSNILNQKDLVSQNHFRNLVNNGTLKNSYSKKMAKTIKKNEKKQTNFIEEGYSSETNTNFQDESKVNNNYGKLLFYWRI